LRLFPVSTVEETMISLLFTILFFTALLAVFWWAIGKFALPYPVGAIVQVVLVFMALIVLYEVLFEGVRLPIIHLHDRIR
jgi:hypothetical protein